MSLCTQACNALRVEFLTQTLNPMHLAAVGMNLNLHAALEVMPQQRLPCCVWLKAQTQLIKQRLVRF